MANPMAIEGRPLLDLVYNAANAGKRSVQTEGIDIAGYQTLRWGWARSRRLSWSAANCCCCAIRLARRSIPRSYVAQSG